MLTGLAGGYLGPGGGEIREVAGILGIDCGRDLLWRVRTLDGAYGGELNRLANQNQNNKPGKGKRQ